jgi:hypothetical protein
MFIIITSHRTPMPLPSCSITLHSFWSIRVSIPGSTAGRRCALHGLRRQTRRRPILQIDPGQILDEVWLILKRIGHFRPSAAHSIRTRRFQLVVFPRRRGNSIGGGTFCILVARVFRGGGGVLHLALFRLGNVLLERPWLDAPK